MRTPRAGAALPVRPRCAAPPCSSPGAGRLRAAPAPARLPARTGLPGRRRPQGGAGARAVPVPVAVIAPLAPRPRSTARAGGALAAATAPGARVGAEEGAHCPLPRPPPRCGPYGPGYRSQSHPTARAGLLTDFKAERKRPSGPERRRAGTAARSGSSESSASGTDARGRGEGRVPPRPAREDGGKGRAADPPLSGPRVLPTRGFLVPGRLCPAEPCPGVIAAGTQRLAPPVRPGPAAEPARHRRTPPARPGLRPTERSRPVPGPAPGPAVRRTSVPYLLCYLTLDLLLQF